MTKTELQQKIVEAIAILNSAVKTLRIYPPSSAIVISTVDKLQDAFTDILAQEASVELAESENKLLISGDVLSLKEQERLPIRAFVEVLLNFTIKSIIFQRGMSREELMILLELLVQPPQNFRTWEDGGLQTILEEKQVSHIVTNQKVYIAKDQESQLLASLDIKDEEIVKYMTEAYPGQDFDVDKIRELAQDEEWVSRIFQSGMTQIMKGRGVVGNSLLTQSMMHMFNVLDKITSPLDQGKICQLIAKSIADLDAEMIRLILSQNLEGLFGGNLFQQAIDQMDGEKFAAVAREMNAATQELAVDGVDREAAQQAYQRLLATDKGIEWQNEITVQQTAELTERETEQEKEKIRFEEQVKEIVNGNDDLFLDPELPASLASLSRQLLDLHEHDLLELLIDRIVKGLTSSVQQVRDGAVVSLAEIISLLPDDRQLAQIDRISGQLVQWIGMEATASRAYRKVCSWLGDLIRALIMKGNFAEVIPILEVFNRIQAGLLDKNDTIDTIVSDLIRGLASGEALAILFDEFDNNRQNKQEEAGRVLMRLGDVPLSQILDRLREVEDTNKRIRILQVIADLGAMAIPAIQERTQGDEPWYYLRNLAYLMGKIGTETSAHVLQPLMLHNNARVRLEALTSLHRTGGKERGPLMMSVLPAADDEYKIKIVEMLGLIKYEASVPLLVDLVLKRPLVTTGARMDLEEKICVALGKIGSPEAMPALKEISHPKGFFRVSKYPEKVRIAAARALVAIEARQVASTPGKAVKTKS